jgi:hypothetical protein
METPTVYIPPALEESLQIYGKKRSFRAEFLVRMLFPTREQKIDDAHGCIAMDCEPFTHLLACLTPDSVTLRDAAVFQVPAIGSFTRAAESMASRGPNCWVRWLSSTFLSFGTASGTIFISRISRSGEIHAPIELCIERVVLSTFAIYEHLAVCTSDSHIYFVDSSASLFYVIDVQFDFAHHKITSACFQPSATIACIVDDRPVFLTLDRGTQFEKRLKPLIKPLPIRSVNRMALNPDGSLLVLSRDDGSVVVVNVGQREAAVIICPATPGNRVSGFIWWANVIGVVRESGSLESYFSFGEHSSTTVFEPLARAISICWDPNSCRLFFGDSKSLSSVHYARTFGHLSATCFVVNDIIRSATIWKSQRKMFPISLVAHDPFSGKVALATPKSVTVIGAVAEPIHATVLALGFLKNLLLVFREGDSREMRLDFYRHDLKFIRSIVFPHPPLALHSIFNVCCVSSDTTFTTLRIVDRPTDVQLGAFYLSVTTRTMLLPIGGVFPVSEKDVMIFYPTRNMVQSLRDENQKIPDVKACWFLSSPPTLFMNAKGRTTVQMAGMVVAFDFCGQFADGIWCYWSGAKVGFGKHSYHTRSYGGYFIAQSITDESVFGGLIELYRATPKFLDALGNALAWAVLGNLLDKWIDFLLGEFDPESVAQILGHATAALSSKPEFFENERWDWDVYLPFLDEATQTAILFAISPGRFAKLKLDGVPSGFIAAALAKNAFVRAFLYSFAHGLDFAPFVQLGLGFDAAVPLFETEFNAWKDLDEIRPKFRCMAASLQNGGLEPLALAWYVAMRDQARASFALDSVDGLDDILRAFTARFPDSEASAFLNAMLSSRGE